VDLLETLRHDLTAERAELDAILAPLSGAAWETPTPADGWTIRDTVAHLHRSDEAALTAMRDPDRFRRDFVAISKGVLNPTYEGDAARLFAAWRATGGQVTEAVAAVPRGEKIVWLGPPLSPPWFLTGRLMETWAHGQDIVDALGLTRVPTGRLRHIADLGVRTRSWSYTTRGRTCPDVPVRVELTGPGQGTWGPEDAADTVRGTALDFCLLVTQRRHRADVAVQAQGPAAQEWLDLAQAYAGPTGAGRSPGQVAQATAGPTAGTTAG